MSQMNAPLELVIEAGRTEGQYWRDLFRYRELFYFLAWRDVLVRYKQTVIGVLWAVIRPVLTMAVFVFVFGRIAKLPSDGVPYPVMVFAAMLPWQLFATSLSEGSNSLITNSNLISKVYFPRLIVPASSVIVSFVDFAISLGLLGLLMAWYHVWPGWHLLALPLFTLLVLVASAGAGLWLAALNVEYRDFRYVVPFIVQFGLYLSPVGFSSNIIPEKWRLLYSLNPMVGVIDGFRWAISGGRAALYLPGLLCSTVVALVLLVTGIWYFRKMERTFADVI
jgi:lipopolysaccharide transport system permease protein